NSPARPQFVPDHTETTRTPHPATSTAWATRMVERNSHGCGRRSLIDGKGHPRAAMPVCGVESGDETTGMACGNDLSRLLLDLEGLHNQVAARLQLLPSGRGVRAVQEVLSPPVEHENQSRVGG